MKIIKETSMKNIFFLLYLCTFLTTSAAEKKLNIQEKSPKVISLKQHTKEIYLLKSKHAQEISRCQAHITSLREALERERKYFCYNTLHIPSKET
jgi:predicted ribosome quality control (RQC) complex YloA/Tae2 family protein